MSIIAPLAGAVLLAEGPSDGGEMTTVSVSPGLPGFFAMFTIAAVVVLLLIDFSRRVRRIQARDRAEQAQFAAAQEKDEQAGPSDEDRPDGPAPSDEDRPDGTAPSDEDRPDGPAPSDEDRPDGTAPSGEDRPLS